MSLLLRGVRYIEHCGLEINFKVGKNFSIFFSRIWNDDFLPTLSKPQIPIFAKLVLELSTKFKVGHYGTFLFLEVLQLFPTQFVQTPLQKEEFGGVRDFLSPRRPNYESLPFKLKIRP